MRTRQFVFRPTQVFKPSRSIPAVCVLDGETADAELRCYGSELADAASEFNGFAACIVFSFHTRLHLLWQPKRPLPSLFRSIYLPALCELSAFAISPISALYSSFSSNLAVGHADVSSCRRYLHVLKVSFSNFPAAAPTTWSRDAVSRGTCALKRDTSVRITVRFVPLA